MTTQTSSQLAHFTWERDPRNPILPPVPESAYDSTACMNPYVVRVGDEYRLYYAGGDADGRRRICLATCPVDDPANLTRHGVVLDLGAAKAFDAHWLVLPLVYRFGERWHLYYTGNHGDWSLGLQTFTGIGLAVSDDGVHFERHSDDPIITGDQTKEFPKNRGIAGGGNIIEVDGGFRLYYTLATGHKHDNVHVDQQKHCVVCHSTDGILWQDHRLIMSPRPDVPSEDVATAAPFVWQDGDAYRMVYCGIGTRWGAYSLAEAVSSDGYTWQRGQGDEAVSLAPNTVESDAWDHQMVEYPCVVQEEGQLRLFYCGNGYGRTGIGLATASLETA